MTRPGFAIVGMACRYPDADNPNQLWENVLAQRRAFRTLPPERLNLADYLSDDRDAADKTYCGKAGVLSGWEFDRNQFRVAGRTYRAADMSHWLALEVASDALADAGFPDGRGLPKVSTGVLVGNSLTGEFSRANLMRLRWPYVARVLDHALQEREWSIDERGQFLGKIEQSYKSAFPPVGDETLAGGLSNTIAGRICNHFDLNGGGYTVDGACASSLLSVSTACSSLAAEDTDVMLAGGVDLSLDPFELVGFAKVGALATEQMRVFDRRSDGFWPGEGCGFVVLMREQDAIDQRRKIYGVIRGWGISSDGSGGITRPETEGQQLCLQRAYRRAGYGADSVGYFEGHGTGTIVGDATELQTISRARRDQANTELLPSVVGSIKANIGHTKAAAGVAGLIKAAMAIDQQLIPPTTGWETPSPVIEQEGDVLRLVHESQPWNPSAPIRAAVSGMGFGGINAHVTLEQPASSQSRRHPIRRDEFRLTCSPQDGELFLFAAESCTALTAQVEKVLGFAARLSFAELGDLAVEMSRRLSSSAIRASITASTPEDLDAAARTLLQWLTEDEQRGDESVAFRRDRGAGVVLSGNLDAPKIGFLFAGQGFLPSVDGGIWRRRFEAVGQLYENLHFPAGGDLVDTRNAQPAIVTAELAGLRVLDELGLRAEVAIGHSLGELSAYHWAGAYDEETLLKLATARGKVIAEHGRDGGAMAGINASVETVNSLIAGTDVAVAAINADDQTVVSGADEAIARLVQRAKEQGISATQLAVSHAFHSPLMTGAVPAFKELLDELDLANLGETVVSTITGKSLTTSTDVRPLLLQQLTSPVQFVNAIRQADDVDLWIEVGPGRVLGSLAHRTVDVPVVSIDSAGEHLGGLLEAIAVAYTMGANIRHQALFVDRFTRPFDFNWQPKFLTSPCESAPASNTPISRVDTVVENEANDADVAVVTESLAPLDCVRMLAAERAELPVEFVKPADRLLNELHLSSIAVGQLVADATRRLGLSPPAQPTYAATATVQDIAEYLQEQLDQGSIGEAPEEEQSPTGIDHWTREFVVRLDEKQRPISDTTNATGEWSIFAGADDPLSAPLHEASAGSMSGSGVVVCLPLELDSVGFERLLTAARQTIRSNGARRYVLVQRHSGLHGDTGCAPFARTLHLEHPEIVTRVVTIPDGHTDFSEATQWIVGETAGSRGHCEAHFDSSGKRREPVWSVLPDRPRCDIPLDPDDVILVTGGGKGIAAECALALARDTGARLALLGRSRPAEDETLRKNLVRMESDGVTLLYVEADVTDEASVSRAVQQIESKLGTITGVLHAAGTNRPQSIDTLDSEAFSQTLGPKVYGLRNVLRYIDAEQLKLLVTFGSIIARVGLRGQADYAVANELLAQSTEVWGREHPDCHTLCLEWSVWAGVGMGESLGVVESLHRDGISALSVDEGIRCLKNCLAQHGPASRVVIASRFGNPSTIQFADPELPLLRFLERPRVYTPGVELVVDAALSMRTDPYLGDHIYQGVPLLPAVVGMEAMAQVATSLIDAQQTRDRTQFTFEQVELLRPIVVPQDGEVTIRVAALARDADSVDLAIRCEESGFLQDHFRARFKLADPTTSISPIHQSVESPEPLSINTADLYGGIFFHQGRFRRVIGYTKLHGTQCVADVDSYTGDDWYGPYLPRQLTLGDPASRDAIIHCIQACIPHGTLLPVAVERVQIVSREAGQIRVHAKERTHDGDEFVYDVDVTQADGRLVEQWQGLRLRKVSQTEPDAQWPCQLLVPYFEHQLRQRYGYREISIALSAGELSAGELSAGEWASDAAISTAANRLTPSRRPDGKPEISDGRSVSASHCDELTMAVVSDRQVACDIEKVNGKDTGQWRDLLGGTRFELAKLIANESGEQWQTAATRVWSASECLTKAGLSAQESLTFDHTAPVGWVTLRCGDRRIATWVQPAHGDRASLVFAILVSPSESAVTCDLSNTIT